MWSVPLQYLAYIARGGSEQEVHACQHRYHENISWPDCFPFPRQREKSEISRPVMIRLKKSEFPTVNDLHTSFSIYLNKSLTHWTDC